jgi:hypothetical protein
MRTYCKEAQELFTDIFTTLTPKSSVFDIF